MIYYDFDNIVFVPIEFNEVNNYKINFSGFLTRYSIFLYETNNSQELE